MTREPGKSMDPARPGRLRVLLCALSLLAVNIAIAATLFGVEYSAYNGSIEGTFIAIPRIMAKYPGQWSWWPYWNVGMPFEVAYLPFTHWVVAAFTLLSGLSAARSFHIVTAVIYVCTAICGFWMALELSRRLMVSWIAALAYSCVSVSSLMVPIFASDGGGPLNLRRLQVLVFYGESPHTMVLALLPVAIVCFSRALTTREVKWKILAGVLAACVVLSNAFGIVVLPVALLCWLMAFPCRPWWKRPLTATLQTNDQHKRQDSAVGAAIVLAAARPAGLSTKESVFLPAMSMEVALARRAASSRSTGCGNARRPANVLSRGWRTT